MPFGLTVLTSFDASDRSRAGRVAPNVTVVSRMER